MKKSTQNNELSNNHLQSINQKVKCIKQHQALDICVNQNCQQINPFICSNQQCQCSKHHEHCVFKRVKQLTKLCQGRKSQILQIENEINKQVDAIIDKLSECRDNLINKLKSQQNTNFLLQNKQQKQILNDFNSLSKLNGSVIHDIFQDLCSQQKENQFQQKITNIQKISEELQQSIDQFSLQLQDTLEIQNQNAEKIEKKKIRQEPREVPMRNRYGERPNDRTRGRGRGRQSIYSRRC